MNTSVSNEIEKIFNAFNELYFDSKLPPPLVTYGNCSYGTLNKNAVVKNGSLYSHELMLPVEILNNSIDEIAACVLHNMIHIYDYVYDKHMVSRGDTYHNKRFKEFAEKCGLTCRDLGDAKGWETFTNEEFKKKCLELGFKKSWSKRYTVPSNMKTNSSTVRYIDEVSNEIVRGTKKNHILFCFNDCPELADEIEKKYGKKRMIMCN